MHISICSFTCDSLRKNIDLVRQLCEYLFYFILFQETLLVDDNLGCLENIHDNYEGVGVTFSDKTMTSNGARCEGGLVCLWSKNYSFIVNSILFMLMI